MTSSAMHITEVHLMLYTSMWEDIHNVYYSHIVYRNTIASTYNEQFNIGWYNCTFVFIFLLCPCTLCSYALLFTLMMVSHGKLRRSSYTATEIQAAF